MITFIVRRILLAALTVLVISFVSFMISQLPEGDLADQFYEFRDGLPAYDSRMMDEFREKNGLFDPLVVQWWSWIYKIITKGDFGKSYTPVGGPNTNGTPVINSIKEYLPYTIYLSIFTTVITWIFAIPIGIYSAMRQNSLGDYIFTFIGFTGLAVPDFLLGLVLMYIAFAYFDHSVGGIFSGEYLGAPWSVARVMDMLQHLIIPGIVLGTAGTAGLIRIMRNNLLDELSKPYVVTATAKGLAGWRVVLKYPVKVALNPFISGIGGTLPSLVSGSVIISIVLSLPTLGPTLLEATIAQDGPMLSAGILMLSVLTVVGTLISDMMLVIVDPRIKLTGSARRG
jgi:peptide/nickel transport system permease protein